MKKLAFNEIGSNFFEEKSSDRIIQNKLPQKDITYLDSGRSAIRLVLDSINLKRKIALLPAYTCNTVIEPFVKRKYQVCYYDVDTNFLIDKEEFKSRVEYLKPSVILLHSYFGKDTIKNIREYLLELRKKDIYIIEDITQLLLQDNKDINTAHFLVGSIRKWCTIPDGGFIKNNTNIRLNLNEYQENRGLLEKQTEAFKRKKEYTKTMKKETKESYLALYKQSKEILDSNDKKIFIMSQVSKELLTKYDFKYIKEQRENNYRYLYDNLKKVNGVQNTLGKLEKGETPLYFPILIDATKRKEFQEYMAKENIYCPIIWSRDKKNLNIQGYNCEDIYEKIICIPCDQRYDEKDMERVVRIVRNFTKKDK